MPRSAENGGAGGVGARVYAAFAFVAGFVVGRRNKSVDPDLEAQERIDLSDLERNTSFLRLLSPSSRREQQERDDEARSAVGRMSMVSHSSRLSFAPSAADVTSTLNSSTGSDPSDDDGSGTSASPTGGSPVPLEPPRVFHFQGPVPGTSVDASVHEQLGGVSASLGFRLALGPGLDTSGALPPAMREAVVGDTREPNFEWHSGCPWLPSMPSFSLPSWLSRSHKVRMASSEIDPYTGLSVSTLKSSVLQLQQGPQLQTSRADAVTLGSMVIGEDGKPSLLINGRRGESTDAGTVSAPEVVGDYASPLSFAERMERVAVVYDGLYKTLDHSKLKSQKTADGDKELEYRSLQHRNAAYAEARYGNDRAQVYRATQEAAYANASAIQQYAPPISESGGDNEYANSGVVASSARAYYDQISGNAYANGLLSPDEAYAIFNEYGNAMRDGAEYAALGKINRRATEMMRAAGEAKKEALRQQDELTVEAEAKIDQDYSDENIAKAVGQLAGEAGAYEDAKAEGLKENAALYKELEYIFDQERREQTNNPDEQVALEKRTNAAVLAAIAAARQRNGEAGRTFRVVREWELEEDKSAGANAPPALEAVVADGAEEQRSEYDAPCGAEASPAVKRVESAKYAVIAGHRDKDGKLHSYGGHVFSENGTVVDVDVEKIQKALDRDESRRSNKSTTSTTSSFIDLSAMREAAAARARAFANKLREDRETILRRVGVLLAAIGVIGVILVLLDLIPDVDIFGINLPKSDSSTGGPTSQGSQNFNFTVDAAALTVWEGQSAVLSMVADPVTTLATLLVTNVLGGLSVFYAGLQQAKNTNNEVSIPNTHGQTNLTFLSSVGQPGFVPLSIEATPQFAGGVGTTHSVDITVLQQNAIAAPAAVNGVENAVVRVNAGQLAEQFNPDATSVVEVGLPPEVTQVSTTSNPTCPIVSADGSNICSMSVADYNAGFDVTLAHRTVGDLHFSAAIVTTDNQGVVVRRDADPFTLSIAAQAEGVTLSSNCTQAEPCAVTANTLTPITDLVGMQLNELGERPYLESTGWPVGTEIYDDGALVTTVTSTDEVNDMSFNDPEKIAVRLPQGSGEMNVTFTGQSFDDRVAALVASSSQTSLEVFFNWVQQTTAAIAASTARAVETTAATVADMSSAVANALTSAVPQAAETTVAANAGTSAVPQAAETTVAANAGTSAVPQAAETTVAANAGTSVAPQAAGTSAAAGGLFGQPSAGAAPTDTAVAPTNTDGADNEAQTTGADAPAPTAVVQCGFDRCNHARAFSIANPGAAEACACGADVAGVTNDPPTGQLPGCRKTFILGC